MPNPCASCNHEESAALNRAIGAGNTLRSISKRFNVSTASIQRHRTEHLGLPLKREPQAPSPQTTGGNSERASGSETERFGSGGEIATAKDLLDRLASLFRLGDLLEAAYGQKDVDACVKIARESSRATATAETYAKIAGMMPDGPSTVIDARRQTMLMVFSDLPEDVLRAIKAGEISLADVKRAAKAGVGQVHIIGNASERGNDVVTIDQVAIESGAEDQPG